MGGIEVWNKKNSDVFVLVRVWSDARYTKVASHHVIYEIRRDPTLIENKNDSWRNNAR